MPTLVSGIVRVARTVTFAAGLVLLLTAQILIPGSGSGVPSSRAIATTSPLSGGGDLSADRTLSCPTCVTSARSVSTSAPLSGGGDLSADRTLSCPTCVTQAYATVQDEGGALTQRSVVNFTGAGVSCADNAGAARTDCTISSGGSDPWTVLTASADSSGASAGTLFDVTGISFSAAASTNYLIECSLIMQTAATTSGAFFAWNTPASPNHILTTYTHHSNASGTATTGFSRADDTTGGNTTGFDAANTNTLVRVSTLFRNGANAGTTQLRAAPEAASTLTVKQDSICLYRSY